jgi:hypothetical protein
MGRKKKCMKRKENAGLRKGFLGHVGKRKKGFTFRTINSFSRMKEDKPRPRVSMCG